jgi:hypothetical protein
VEERPLPIIAPGSKELVAAKGELLCMIGLATTGAVVIGIARVDAPVKERGFPIQASERAR